MLIYENVELGAKILEYAMRTYFYVILHNFIDLQYIKVHVIFVIKKLWKIFYRYLARDTCFLYNDVFIGLKIRHT